MATKHIKVVLFGSGESGKTTFIKQLRIIYGDGYSEEDLRDYCPVIVQSIFVNMRTLMEAMKMLGLEFHHSINTEYAQFVQLLDYEKIQSLTLDHTVIIKSLWNDCKVQECWRRRREFQITDSAKYYFDNVDRIARMNYLPTLEDILRVRIPTTGIFEYQFKLESTTFSFIDVGGQRSERRKWIHCFEHVKCILFIAAVSEYNQVLRECNSMNRLAESAALCQIIFQTTYFKTTTKILFFNKMDLLEEKLAHYNVKDFFPEYTGPVNDFLMAYRFFKSLFLTKGNAEFHIYVHQTCVTDTQLVEKVFNQVKNVIINNQVKRLTAV